MFACILCGYGLLYACLFRGQGGSSKRSELDNLVALQWVSERAAGLYKAARIHEGSNVNELHEAWFISQ